MFYISSEVCRTKGQSKWKMYVFFELLNFTGNFIL